MRKYLSTFKLILLVFFVMMFILKIKGIASNKDIKQPIIKEEDVSITYQVDQYIQPTFTVEDVSLVYKMDEYLTNIDFDDVDSVITYNISYEMQLERDYLLTDNNIEKIDAMFNLLIEKGYSVEAACGILGNVITESSLNKNLSYSTGYYHGYYQMSDIIWNGYLEWCYSNNYTYDSLISQTIYVTEECLDSDFDIYATISLEEFKELDDPELAADAFCVAFERAVSDGSGDYGISSYNNNMYQRLNERKEWAKIMYNYYNEK